MESPSHKAQLGRAPLRRTGPAFDYECSLARLGGDPALFNEIVLLFLEDSPELAARARRGLQEQDLPELERAAHSLKGLSVNFEARALAAAAFSVEQHARDGDLERAAACFPEMESELEKLQAELAEFHQAHGNADEGHPRGDSGAIPPT